MPYRVLDDGQVQYYPDVQVKGLQEIYNFESISAEAEVMTAEKQLQSVHPTLKRMLENDAYNTYCVDCKINLSECCSLNFGIFICHPCALEHQKLLGAGISFLKSLASAEWDDYLLRFMLYGGNKLFYEFLNRYKLDGKPLVDKYKHVALQWY